MFQPDTRILVVDDMMTMRKLVRKALTELGDTSGRDILIAVLAGDRKDAPGMMTNAMRDAKDLAMEASFVHFSPRASRASSMHDAKGDFVNAFVAAWVKVMDLDRLDVK